MQVNVTIALSGKHHETHAHLNPDEVVIIVTEIDFNPGSPGSYWEPPEPAYVAVMEAHYEGHPDIPVEACVLEIYRDTIEDALWKDHAEKNAYDPAAAYEDDLPF